MIAVAVWLTLISTGCLAGVIEPVTRPLKSTFSATTLIPQWRNHDAIEEQSIGKSADPEEVKETIQQIRDCCRDFFRNCNGAGCFAKTHGICGSRLIHFEPFCNYEICMRVVFQIDPTEPYFMSSLRRNPSFKKDDAKL